jgi:hypothetical protein
MMDRNPVSRVVEIEKYGFSCKRDLMKMMDSDIEVAPYRSDMSR